MSNQGLIRFCEESGITCLINQPMCAYTSFEIGGAAEVLVKPDSVEQIAQVMRYLTGQGVQPLMIGNGSDLLVCDAGIQQPVIHIGAQLGGVWLEGNDQIVCAAGIPLAKLCAFARDHALTGLEFAFGIPGNVGGAVYMNAGAYGGEMKDVVAQVTHVTPQGTTETVVGQQCGFSYRHSIYAENGCCIAQVRFQLAKGDSAAIRAQMEDLMNRRKTKQPLEYPSAGSTFKRPAGGYASELIDRCGLKGRQVGGAMVSEKHAGFVINYNHATCADVLALVRVVQDEVRRQTGTALECEIKIIG